MSLSGGCDYARGYSEWHSIIPQMCHDESAYLEIKVILIKLVQIWV